MVSIQFAKGQLQGIVQKFKKFASREQSKAILTGICIRSHGHFVGVYATDGHRLAKYELNIECEEFTSLISPDDFAAISKIKKSETITYHREPREDGCLDYRQTLTYGGQGLTLTDDAAMLGTYPQCEQLIPRDFEHNVTVDSAKVTDAIKLISKVDGKRSYSNGVLLCKFVDNRLYLKHRRHQDTAHEFDRTTAIDNVMFWAPYSIAFTTKYLRDFLESVKGEAVIRINKNTQPVIVSDPKDPNLTLLLMPVQIRDRDLDIDQDELYDPESRFETKDSLDTCYQATVSSSAFLDCLKYLFHAIRKVSQSYKGDPLALLRLEFKDQLLTVVGTNGYILRKRTMPFKPSDEMVMSGKNEFKITINPESDFDADFLDTIKQSLELTIGFRAQDEYRHFAEFLVDGKYFSFDSEPGSFPDIEKVVNEGSNPVANIDTKELAKAINQVKGASDKKHFDQEYLRVKIIGGLCTVCHESDDEQENNLGFSFGGNTVDCDEVTFYANYKSLNAICKSLKSGRWTFALSEDMTQVKIESDSDFGLFLVHDVSVGTAIDVPSEPDETSDPEPVQTAAFKASSEPVAVTVQTEKSSEVITGEFIYELYRNEVMRAKELFTCWVHEPKPECIVMSLKKRQLGLASNKGQVYLNSAYIGTQAHLDLLETMRHELAHLIAGTANGHNQRFLDVCERLGIENPTTKHRVKDLELLKKFTGKWTLYAITDDGPELIGYFHRRDKKYTQYDPSVCEHTLSVDFKKVRAYEYRPTDYDSVQNFLVGDDSETTETLETPTQSASKLEAIKLRAAAKYGVDPALISDVREWQHVGFVVIAGLGGRFVSKKGL